jgi:type VI protein secretion system component VasK
MRDRLAEIQATAQPWASNRAGFMLAVLEQLDSGAITEAQAQDWMLDVTRTIDTDADSASLAQELRNLARQIGE